MWELDHDVLDLGMVTKSISLGTCPNETQFDRFSSLLSGFGYGFGFFPILKYRSGQVTEIKVLTPNPS